MSSIVLYGPPGGGKTTFAATMCKLSYRCIWIDFDRKVELMHNLQPYLKKKQIEVWRPESKLAEGSFLARVKAGPKTPQILQPKGFLEFADMMNKLETEVPDDSENVVLVIDSLTRVIEHYKRYHLHIQKKTHFVYEDWGFILSNLEEVFDHFFGLQPSPYAHSIIICHDQMEKDELTGSVKILPLIDGSMKNKVGSYVEEMYYCYVEVDKEGQAEYYALTKPVNKVAHARTSRELDTYVEPDFSEIFAKRGVRQ